MPIKIPPIVNPARVEWRPSRADSADVVLGYYLHGDVPRPKREHEDDEAYRKRLESQSLTVCPLTNLPFWYNVRLKCLPAEVAAGSPERILYFYSQRKQDGSWPTVTEDGDPGVFAVSGFAVHSQITPEEVENLREKIAIEAAEDPNSTDIGFWRRRLAHYDEQTKKPPTEPCWRRCLYHERTRCEGSCRPST